MTHCKPFLLRLPLSIREQATALARQDGSSLNHFIAIALAEKISNMNPSAPEASVPPRRYLERPFAPQRYPAQPVRPSSPPAPFQNRFTPKVA